jgi:NAD(P)H-dependent FMN reductase
MTSHVVIMSGSLRAGSTSDRVAASAARHCVRLGASARVFTGAELEFPFYRPGLSGRHEGVRRLLGELGRADGVVLVSPTYHGTVSGLLKNALDFVNDMDGPRAYLDGRPIGCVAVGAGAQGAVSTLGTLRTISHAVRGWPTPLGLTVHSAGSLEPDSAEADPRMIGQLTEMVSQVLSMGGAHRANGIRQAQENSYVAAGAHHGHALGGSDLA